MATFKIISEAYVEQAPLVYSNEKTTPNRSGVAGSGNSNFVFTLAMFTTETTTDSGHSGEPIFTDPEGGNADILKIESLPTSGTGTLELSGTPVTVGQNIPLTEISSGNLVFISPDQDAQAVANFDFEISSSVSGLFSDNS